MGPTEQLRAARLRRGWTQEEMGKFLGVTAIHVSRMETGKRRVLPWVIIRLNESDGGGAEAGG